MVVLINLRVLPPTLLILYLVLVSLLLLGSLITTKLLSSAHPDAMDPTSCCDSASFNTSSARHFLPVLTVILSLKTWMLNERSEIFNDDYSMVLGPLEYRYSLQIHHCLAVFSHSRAGSSIVVKSKGNACTRLGHTAYLPCVRDRYSPKCCDSNACVHTASVATATAATNL